MEKVLMYKNIDLENTEYSKLKYQTVIKGNKGVSSLNGQPYMSCIILIALKTNLSLKFHRDFQKRQANLK